MKKRINSRRKGANGERLWRDELRAMGFGGEDTRRGQQFAGGGDSPDVVCPCLKRLHCEVKVGYPGMDLGTKLLADACKQAKRDAGVYEYESGQDQTGEAANEWYVAWKPDRKPWRITFDTPTWGLVTVSGRADIKRSLEMLNKEV